MLDDLLRPVKDRLLAPVVRGLGPAVTPNLLSVVSFGFGVAAAGLAARRLFGAALACWLLNRVIDGLDGAAARLHGRQSDRGAYLDILLDFTVYALVPVGLVLGAPSERTAVAALVMLGTFYLNAASWLYLSALLERRGQGAAARGEPTAVTMPAGLVAGTETIVVYALFFLMPGHLATLFLATAALVAVTAVQRAVWGWRRLA